MQGWVHRQQPLPPEASIRAAAALLTLEAWPGWMAGGPMVLAEGVGQPEPGMLLHVHRVVLGAPVVESWRVEAVRSGDDPPYAEVQLCLEGQARGTVPVGRAFEGLRLRLTVLAEQDGGVEVAVQWRPRGLHRLLGRRLRTDVRRLMDRWLSDLEQASMP